MGINYWEVVRMKKMKRVIVSATAIICECFSPIAVKASIDDVNTFLQQYENDDNAFYTEEYSGKDSEGTEYKTLIVRTDLFKVNVSFMDMDEIFANMSSQEWFDYTTICSIGISSNVGFLLSTNVYDTKSGTKINSLSDHPLSMRFPWIIKTENDLSDEERTFLMRITQEILQSELDKSISLNIGTENESKCTFKACNGLAEVSGEYELNNVSYKFITQFTYETEDNQNGTYEELYTGANDIDIFGTKVMFEHRTYDN